MKKLFGFLVLAALCSVNLHLAAQQIPASYTIDATTPAPAPDRGFLHLGGVSPSGHSLAVNSRYLTLDGKPWLPVMGEFQFSRYPEKYWQEELLKMKAGGISIVGTYVFWIHHEEIEGQFDWSGQRDLRRFVQLCAQDGLHVYLRIGPWDHGEARNGGFPDWLVAKKIPLRRNDPEYLKYVSRFYNQIGQQTRGLMWQQGGPIVGVQLENEYGVKGPGAGEEHIAELRHLAIAAGINPPLFSVTAWPVNGFPPHEFIPFFGGYPDDFWTTLRTDRPPNPLYLFDADRAVGDMGAMGASNPKGAQDLRHYPFFSTERGGGMETSYHRRPLIDPDDIAALTLAGLGSGINLYGYYVFQGGANPAGKLTTLQESTATNYPNDLPVVSYDFQAPLGQYGQERASFRKLKALHLFIKSFGANLAPMAPYAPAQLPKDAADRSRARIMLRAQGNSGFLFVNNYVRKYEMPEQPGFQVQVKLPSGTVTLPAHSTDVPANSYFILPVNLNLGAGTLRYSTAQLLTRVEQGTEATYFFFAIPGFHTEFAFDPKDVRTVTASSGDVQSTSDAILVQNPTPGRGCVLEVTGSNGRHARIVVLTQREAEDFWQLSTGGKKMVLLSSANVFADAEGVHLRSVDPAKLQAWVFAPSARNTHMLWQERNWKITPRTISYSWSKLRDAADRPELRMGRVHGRAEAMPIAPDDADYRNAAAWTLMIPAQSMTGLSDIFMRIHYAGDVARLYENKRLLDDDFYNGRIWEIGLKRFLPQAFGKKLEVDVLPLPHGAPIYLDQRAWAQMNPAGQTAKVTGVQVLPEYEEVLRVQTLAASLHAR